MGTADNFYCPVCNNGSTHTSMQECPNNTSMRTYGSGYKVSGVPGKCKRGCAKNHPDNLCPKNRNSIMHPSNKNKRDRLTHKESKKHDKEVSGKGGICSLILVAMLGGVVTLAYAAVEIIRSL